MKYLILSLIFAFEFTNAQSRLESIVNQGLNYFYNSSFEKAINEFSKIEKLPKYSYYSDYHKSRVYLWDFMRNNSQEKYELFFNHSNRAIKQLEVLLVDNNKDAQLNFLLGSLYGLQALAYVEDNAPLDAFWATKKSFSFSEIAIKLKPDLYDAYFFLGLLNYEISFTPEIFKWALDYADLKVERDKGINYINDSANKGKYFKDEAKFHLARIYNDLYADYSKSISTINELVKKYPHNQLFNSYLSLVLINNRKIKEAENNINKKGFDKSDEYDKIQQFTLLLKADVEYIKNNFNLAQKYYKEFLKNNIEENNYAYANFRIGIIHDINDLNDSAKIYYEKALSFNPSISNDYQAVRKSKYFLHNEFNNDHKALITIKNRIEAGNDKSSFKDLLRLKDTVKTEFLVSEINYLLSLTSFNLKQYSDAQYYADLAFKGKNNEENWIKPFALLIKAKSYIEIDKFQDAKSTILQIKKFNDYEFSEKINATILDLENKMKTKK